MVDDWEALDREQNLAAWGRGCRQSIMVGGLGTQIVDLNSPLTLPLSPPAADGRDVAYSILEYYKLELV
jgi:hypothetical protein